MSLKSILYNIIKNNGEISIAEVYQICTIEHKKQSNAERRLREMSEKIEPIRKKNYIVGYRFKREVVQEKLL